MIEREINQTLFNNSTRVEAFNRMDFDGMMKVLDLGLSRSELYVLVRELNAAFKTARDHWSSRVATQVAKDKAERVQKLAALKKL